MVIRPAVIEAPRAARTSVNSRARRATDRVGSAALAIALAACGPTSRPGGDRDADVPAACQSCPDDCCRLPGDAGFACMNFDHRNPTTFECSCGAGPACDALQTCCPPNNSPAPLLPAVCVTGASQCDPRPSGMP